MAYQEAELARQVADIIDFEPEIFNMSSYDCGTTACIAGHIGRLTGDLFMDDKLPGHLEWRNRQGAKIGLDGEASWMLFSSSRYVNLSNTELSEVLRRIAKEAEETDPDEDITDSEKLATIFKDIKSESEHRKNVQADDIMAA